VALDILHKALEQANLTSNDIDVICYTKGTYTIVSYTHLSKYTVMEGNIIGPTYILL